MNVNVSANANVSVSVNLSAIVLDLLKDLQSEAPHQERHNGRQYTSTMHLHCEQFLFVALIKKRKQRGI